MRLYLNERPRTFVIVSNSHALIIRHPYPKYKGSIFHSRSSLNIENVTNNGEANKVIAEFVKKDVLDLSGFTDISPNANTSTRQLLGFLGLLSFRNNVFLSFITQHSKVAAPTPYESIYRIEDVHMFCLNSDEYDFLIGKYNDDQYQPSQSVAGQIDAAKRVTSGYPVASVRLMLGSGSFYYSRNFDITSNLQERGISVNKSFNSISADSPYFRRFWWNSYLNFDILEFRNRLPVQDRLIFDRAGFLTIITRGYARTVNTMLSSNHEALLTVISKQSCAKNGPLFGYWGSDDNGAVSNYAETEVIICSKEICFSYVIVRGNVPVFWHLKSSHKKSLINVRRSKTLKLPRSFEASDYAFSKHFSIIAGQYTDTCVVNLLGGSSKTYKEELNAEFKAHVKSYNSSKASKDEMSNSSNYGLQCVDLPLKLSYVKKIGYSRWNPQVIVDMVADSIVDYGAFFYDFKTSNYIGKQLGVIRIVSFDSSEKANFISKIISQEVITLAFKDIGIEVPLDLFDVHAKLWVENEAVLKKTTHDYAARSSRIQASSGSTTKGSVKSIFSKKYLSGVVDPKVNETAMLKLLGSLQDQVRIELRNPIQDYVSTELHKSIKKYSYIRDISVFTTTFNVNGLSYDGDIREWIHPAQDVPVKDYAIVFVGLEEITELSAGQMMNPDVTNRIFWEKKINTTLNQNQNKQKYVSIWTTQMGGIAALLYVRSDLVEHIHDVESSYKKTGFGGVSANKGGVAVSFSFANTDLCFVVSHLAAGLANVDERHQDYKSISKGIKFSKNRRIKDHDAVIWLGDFNFRIGLPNSQAKPLIEKREFSRLFDFDQLNAQMANGESFPFFDEMEIKFAPTYKFDLGTQEYDTSEKQRVPAWTDRVLSMSRKKIIRQTSYNSVPGLCFSDHRPVYATFNISVTFENKQIKRDLSKELYETYKKNIGDINELLTSNNISSFITDTSADVLPPPSSDFNKWWLEGGKAAKITIPKLSEEPEVGKRTVINPFAPCNPFVETDEPEFIKIAAYKSPLNTFS